MLYLHKLYCTGASGVVGDTGGIGGASGWNLSCLILVSRLDEGSQAFPRTADRLWFRRLLGNFSRDRWRISRGFIRRRGIRVVLEYGKLSALDAAAKVLEESREPLTTKIATMAAKSY